MSKIHIKDKEDFLKNKHLFDEMVFWKENSFDNTKVEIKCAIPIYKNEVLENLSKIKN